ncbi:MAG: transcriptional repressor [Thermotogota bacterium]|nr:transcriptional repressor [Thermotogota bacterium]
MQFTKNRQLVYEVLKKANKPLATGQIKKKLDETMDQSTVYRALDFLEEKHYIESASFGKTVRLFFCKNKFKHFLYCEHCSDIQVFDECAAKALEEVVMKEHRFQINSHIFYFTGLCEKCKGEEEK